MLPKTHLAATMFLAAGLILIGLADMLQAFLLIFGGFLIDTDHYIWYVWNKKDWSLKRSYKWHYSLYLKKEKRKFLHVFHTVESFIVVSLLSFWHFIFLYILFGMVFHMILDVIQAVNHRFYAKEISSLYSLIKGN